MFIPTSKCFICGLPLGERAGAAQLDYAWEEDVGVVARNGQAYVHRTCWEQWPQREAWARSSLRRWDKEQSPAAVGRAGYVVLARARQDAVELYDYWQPVRAMVADAQQVALLEALTRHAAFDLAWASAIWHIGDGERPLVTQTWGDRVIERFIIERPEDWIAALRAVA